jgi:hypothetical protein
MSDVVNTSVAPFCHRQDHPGSVPVPAVGVSALPTQESSFSESESLLGSRETTRTRHRRMGGLNQHHLPASPRTTCDQFALRYADRRISSLSGKCRLGEKCRSEVLDSDQVMTVDDALGPNPRVVPRLSCGLLVQLRSFPAGPLVPVGLRATLAAVSPGHLSLRLAELGGAAFPMTEIRQVESGTRGRGCDGYTPVDADPTGFVDFGGSDGFASYHERGVPMPERVLMNTNTGRLGWQLARPHDRDHDALGQTQPTVADREPSGGVLQRRESLPARFKCRAPSALHRERVLQRLRIGPQRLLLRDLRTLAEPRATSARLRKQLSELRERRPAAGLLLPHSLVPQVPAPMPLGFKCAHSYRSRSQSVAIPHYFPHASTVSAGTDINRGHTRHSCHSNLVSNLKGWVSTRESP